MTAPEPADQTRADVVLSEAERAGVCPTCEALPGNSHDPQNDMGCAWTDALVAAVERVLADRLAAERAEHAAEVEALRRDADVRADTAFLVGCRYGRAAERAALDGEL